MFQNNTMQQFVTISAKLRKQMRYKKNVLKHNIISVALYILIIIAIITISILSTLGI